MANTPLLPPRGDRKAGERRPLGPRPMFSLWYVLGFLMLLGVAQAWFLGSGGRAIPYSEFKSLVRANKVAEVTVGDQTITGKLKEATGEGRQRTDAFVRPYLNATQEGPPLVEAFRELAGAWDLRPVYFNHGTQRAEDEDRVTIQLGKAWLVSRLRVLFQRDRLHLLRSPEALTLRRELETYRIDLPEDAATRYGAFRVGSQDDLLTALGLAVQEDIAPYSAEDAAALDEALANLPLSPGAAIEEMYRKLGL